MTISVLVALALLVRWPNLGVSPPYPALGQTVNAAMAVAAGGTWPLTDQAPYLGAPFVYLLAAVYRVLGPSVEATLILGWLIGGLTLVPVYLLGKEVAGRTTAVVASALMVTSPAHTVISSHVPWIHSLTPLVATLTLWFLVRAVRRRDYRSLLFAGLCAGLAFQTHPTVLPLLTGALTMTMIGLRAWRKPSVILAVGALVILGYGPLLVHQATTHFQVADDVQSKRARYLDAENDSNDIADRGVYTNNLVQLTSSLARLSAGELLEDRSAPIDYLGDPRIMVYPALGLVGLLVLPRRSGWLLLAGIFLSMLLPPMLNGKYKPVLDGRYLMPVVPVLFVGIGGLVSSAVTSPLASGRRMLSTAVLGLASGLLVLCPLISLGRFYEESTEDGASNQRYSQALASILEQRQTGELVWLDPRLRDVRMPDGGSNADKTFGWLLTVSGVPTAELSTSVETSSLVGRLVILHRATATELRQRVTLNYLDGEINRGKDQPSYRVSRIAPIQPLAHRQEAEGRRQTS